MKKFLSLAVVAACASVAFAADVYVDGTNGLDTNAGTQVAPVKTIAKGVDIAVAGDRVNVLAGAYAAPIAINKAVYVLGPNATKAGYAGDRVAEAVISGAITNQGVMLSADGASFEGFKVEAMTTDETHAINAFTSCVYGGAPNVTIANNLVIGIPDNAGKGPNGIVCMSFANNTVSGNYVKDVLTLNRSGIKIQSCADARVLNNKVENCQYNGIAFDSSANSLADGNTVLTTGQPGIQVANNSAGATVTNNIVTGANSSNGADKGGIAVASGASNVVIKWNKLTNNGTAAISYRNVATALGTEDVQFNSFLGNNLGGIYNGRSSVVTAPNNYWNNAGGPTVTGADAVKLGANGGTVTVTPFATAAFPDSSVSDWTRF